MTLSMCIASKLKTLDMSQAFNLIKLFGIGDAETFSFPKEAAEAFGDSIGIPVYDGSSENLDLSVSCAITNIDYLYFYTPKKFKKLLDRLKEEFRRRLRNGTPAKNAQKIFMFTSSYVAKRIEESPFWSYATRASLGEEYAIAISAENLVSKARVFAYLRPESRDEIVERFIGTRLKDPNLLDYFIRYITDVSSQIAKITKREIETNHELLKDTSKRILDMASDSSQLICQLPDKPKVICIPRKVVKIEAILKQAKQYEIGKAFFNSTRIGETEIDFFLYVNLLKSLDLIIETATAFIMRPRLIWWLEENEEIKEILFRCGARGLLEVFPRIDPDSLGEIKKGFRNVFTELTEIKDFHDIRKILIAEWWHKIFSRLGKSFSAYFPLPDETAGDHHIGEVLRRIQDEGEKWGTCDLLLPFLVDEPIPATFTEAIKDFFMNNMPLEASFLDGDQLERYYKAIVAIAGLFDILRSQLKSDFKPSQSFIELLNLMRDDWIRQQYDEIVRELMVFLDSKIKERKGGSGEIKETKKVVSKHFDKLLTKLISLPDITEWGESCVKDVKSVLSRYRKEVKVLLSKSPNFDSIVSNDFMSFMIDQWANRAKLFPFLTLYTNWGYGHLSKILYSSFFQEQEEAILNRMKKMHSILLYLHKEFSYLGIHGQTLRKLKVCEEVIASIAAIRRSERSTIDSTWCENICQLFMRIKPRLRAQSFDEEIIWREFMYREVRKLERYFTKQIIRTWKKADVTYLPQVGKIADNIISDQIASIENADLRSILHAREWDSVLLVVVDSLSYQEFLQYFDSADFDLVLPAISTLPSETFSGHSSIATGKFPDEHGIWGKTFLDARTGKEVEPCGNIDFKQSLFHKVNSHIDRLIFSRFDWQGLGEILCMNKDLIHEPMLDERFEQALRCVRHAREQGRRSIMMLQVDLLDSVGHRTKAPVEEQRVNLKRFHRFVYKAFSEYLNSRIAWLSERLREIGGNYIIILTADHGKILRDEYKSLYKHYRVKGIKEDPNKVLVHPRFALIYEKPQHILENDFVLEIGKPGRYNPKAIYIPPYLLKSAKGAIHGGAFFEEMVIPFAIKKI